MWCVRALGLRYLSQALLLYHRVKRTLERTVAPGTAQGVGDSHRTGTTSATHSRPGLRALRRVVGPLVWASRGRGERRCFTCSILRADGALPGAWTGEISGRDGGDASGLRTPLKSASRQPRPAPAAPLCPPLSMVGAGRSARRSMVRAAGLSVRRAGRKAERGPGLFGSGGAVRAAGSGGHGGPQVLPVDLGAVPLPQPGAEGASGELGAERRCLLRARSRSAPGRRRGVLTGPSAGRGSGPGPWPGLPGPGLRG